MTEGRRKKRNKKKYVGVNRGIRNNGG